MPLPIFYSVSPYGTGNIETGAGNISVTSGIGTFTVEQEGNIGMGTAVQYNSLTAWIAPNRIGFDSGSTEIIFGDKVEGGTSGATGIIIAVALTSGTWGGADAAGYLYFETTSGTWQDNEDIDIVKPDGRDQANAATTDGTLEGNIGNGNTQFVMLQADGTDAANQTSTAVTSVNHEWASIDDFILNADDANHINDTDLTNADVIAICCCYYDHDGTPDTDINNVDVTGYTTDTTNYIHIYVPTGGSCSINNQRHEGVWNNNRYILESDATQDNTCLINQEIGTKITGLQVEIGTDRTFRYGIYCLEDNVDIGYCLIMQNNSTASVTGIFVGDSDGDGFRFHHSVIYNISAAGILLSTAAGGSFVYNIVCYGNGGRGIDTSFGDTTVYNCICYNNTGEDFDTTGWAAGDYCFSEDGTAPGANSLKNSVGGETPDFVNTGSGTEDFHIQSTSDAIDAGTNLNSDSDLPIWRDIDLEEITGTWDIGVDEYFAGDLDLIHTIITASSATGTHALAVDVYLSHTTITASAITGTHSLSITSGDVDLVHTTITASSVAGTHLLAVDVYLSHATITASAVTGTHVLAVDVYLSHSTITALAVVGTHNLSIDINLSHATITASSVTGTHTLAVDRYLEHVMITASAVIGNHVLAIDRYLSHTTTTASAVTGTHTLITGIVFYHTTTTASSVIGSHVLAVDVYLSHTTITASSVLGTHVLAVDVYLSHTTITALGVAGTHSLSITNPDVDLSHTTITALAVVGNHVIVINVLLSHTTTTATAVTGTHTLTTGTVTDSSRVMYIEQDDRTMYIEQDDRTMYIEQST